MIAVGDKEIDNQNQVSGEITWIGQSKPYEYSLEIAPGRIFTKKDPILKILDVKLKLRAEVRNDYLYYKDSKIAINSLIELKTDKYTVQGKIDKVYETTLSPIKEKWLQVQVKFQGVIPESAKIINEGDAEKDPTGKAVGRLKVISSNKASDVLMLKEDRFITVPHPFLRDITATLDFLCTEKDGVLYFKNYPVKMGNTITFTTDLYSMSGTVMGIKVD